MSKQRILVVDDEEAICDVISFNLEIEGYDVEAAYSAEEALTKDIASIDEILEKRDRLFEDIATVTKNQLQRINDTSVETPTRASLLYLEILNETKSMVLQARNLVKSQRYFIENQIQ